MTEWIWPHTFRLMPGDRGRRVIVDASIPGAVPYGLYATVWITSNPSNSG